MIVLASYSLLAIPFVRCFSQWRGCTFTANIIRSGILSAEEMLCLREETVTSIWRWPEAGCVGVQPVGDPFWLGTRFHRHFLCCLTVTVFISHLQFVQRQPPNQSFSLFSSKIEFEPSRSDEFINEKYNFFLFFIFCDVFLNGNIF